MDDLQISRLIKKWFGVLTVIRQATDLDLSRVIGRDWSCDIFEKNILYRILLNCFMVMFTNNKQLFSHMNMGTSIYRGF